MARATTSRAKGKGAKAGGSADDATAARPAGAAATWLGEAIGHLQRGEREQALSALLDAWRGRRADELADVIDVVSRDIDRALAPIEGDDEVFHERWTKVSLDGREVDVERLLPGVLRGPFSTVDDRVDALCKRPHDPRVARGFAAMIEQPPTTASARFGMWRKLFKHLEDVADQRVLGALAKGKKNNGKSLFWPLYHALIDKLKKALPGAPALTDAERAEIALARQLAEALLAGPAPALAKAPAPAAKPSVDEGALLAAVYAAPDDDAPRLAYADALIAREDPWGAMIKLQIEAEQRALTSKERSFVKKTLKAHAKRVLGPIFTLTRATYEGHYERGFLSHAQVSSTKAADVAPTIGDPRWRTVDAFEGITEAAVPLLFTPELSRLRSIGVASLEALAALLERPEPLAVEVLTAPCTQPFSDAIRRRLAAASCASLPRLRRLSITDQYNAPLTFDDYRWLFEGPLGKRLEHVSIASHNEGSKALDARRPQLAEMVAAAARLQQLKTVHFNTRYDVQIAVVNDPGDRRVKLGLNPYELTTGRSKPEHIVTLLEGLSSEIVVDLYWPDDLEPRHQQQMKRLRSLVAEAHGAVAVRAGEPFPTYWSFDD